MDEELKVQEAARSFAEYWRGRGYEKGESQKFWLMLLRTVLGAAEPESFIEFEDQVHIDRTSFIDAMIPLTHVMIEQKSQDKDLLQPIVRSDGLRLTPFAQAKRYSSELPYSKRPRWIVTCNFKTFHIYDMEKPDGEPQVINLADLEKDYYRLAFLCDPERDVPNRELEVSLAAGEIVGMLYDALKPQYRAPDSPETLRSLNILCVRLVFCLYAEDAGVFERRNMFHDYLEEMSTQKMRVALRELFKVLDTPVDKRDPYLADDNPKLAAFPYVDGGLFEDETIEIPPFTEKLKDLLLTKASAEFDWSGISPTIFGSVFESTLNPATRRSGGMHYTSPENIDKALDPLFMDELTTELEEIKTIAGKKARDAKLHTFQDKIAALTFLDPACGSGNFLTRAYTRLRELENEAILAMSENSDIASGQAGLGTDSSLIKVSVDQFYGIEINDFAVNVAKTALWIAERQMLSQTERIVGRDLDFLPIKTQTQIAEGNALCLDWGTLEGAKAGLTVEDTLFAGATKGKRYAFNYIVGNPPFVGYSLQNDKQKADIRVVCAESKKAGKLDYVAGWYYKAASFIRDTQTRCAFVSTNSITQGEQVAALWKPLFADGLHIDFAYRTFKWQSESTDMAAVFCVVVGFSTAPSNKPKVIYEERMVQEGKGERELVALAAHNINAYLSDAPDVFIESRKKPICDVPPMVLGSIPRDGGAFYLSPQERKAAVKREPAIEKFIKRVVGSEEFINGKERYCLWLVDSGAHERNTSRLIQQRMERVREFRLKSKRKTTRDLADEPFLFAEIRQPNRDYLIVPRVSSDRRKYIPMGFLPPDVICADAAQLIPDATLYHFGVLTSSVHMAWMRAVAGRLGMDFRYSSIVVYNTFVWPDATSEQRTAIEQTAQAILDARAKAEGSTLADLYKDLNMPPDLRRAHEANDRAVLVAYGWGEDTQESGIVSHLMEMYQQKAGG